MSNTFTTGELSNGLRFLHVPVAQAQSVYVSLIGAVGRRAEEANEVGAAHFLEHLFFDGTKKRPTALEVNRFVESIGAMQNGSTWMEAVNYFAKATSDKAEEVCDFIADIFQHSLLTDIQKERQVIAQEAAFKRDDPLQSLLRKRFATLYPGQRMGRSIFDEDINLPNMTEAVIRAYYERTYVAENFLLCITGAISFENAQRLAEKYFASIKNGTPTTFAPAVIAKEKKVVIDHQAVQQSKVILSYAGFAASDPRAVQAELLSFILGRGLSSRLGDALRNKLHLVYALRALSDEYSDTGYFSIMTFTDEAKLQQAITEIISQLQKVVDDGVTQQELERAQTMLRAQLQFAAEDVMRLGDQYAAQYLLTGKVKDIASQIAEINAVTTADILAVARTIFADQPKVNVVTKSVSSLDVPSIRI